MDNQVQVFETPDYPKTIDELNQQLQPKIVSHNIAIQTRSRDLSIHQIFDFYNSINSEQSRSFDYLQQQKIGKKRYQKLPLLQEELRLIFQQPDSQKNPQIMQEISQLQQKLDKLKQQKPIPGGSNVNAKPLQLPVQSRRNFTPTDITYSVSVTNLKQQLRLSILDKKIREMQHALGDWKHSRPINQTLGETLGRVRLCNTSILKKLENQARHASTNLDVLYISKAQVQAKPELIMFIQSLHAETHHSLTKLAEFPQLIQQLKASFSLHQKHIALDKMLLKLESSSDSLSSFMVQATQLVDSISANIQTSQERLSSNCKILEKRGQQMEQIYRMLDYIRPSFWPQYNYSFVLLYIFLAGILYQLYSYMKRKIQDRNAFAPTRVNMHDECRRSRYDDIQWQIDNNPQLESTREEKKDKGREGIEEKKKPRMMPQQSSREPPRYRPNVRDRYPHMNKKGG